MPSIFCVVVSFPISTELPPPCTYCFLRLATVIAHPNFDENRWIYLFYTYNQGDTNCDMSIETGPVNRCSRFVVNDDWTVDDDSEFVLFQTSSLLDKVHNGGDMEFGNDGMLYIVTGDSGARSLQYAQLRHNLFGSILRITDSGEIPDDNPFTGEGTARCNETGQTEEGTICQEIFAYGLRNPFRFAIDPYVTDKTRLLINDVGEALWEEVNIGGTDYAGKNYGWPTLEGPCSYNSVDRCAIADSSSQYQDPYFWYQHNDAEEGCAVGIAVPPPGLNWPAPYSNPNSFFFVDFVWGNFYHITEDADAYCNTCMPPVPGFHNETFHWWDRPVGLKFGPYVDHSGNNEATTPLALYYTARKGDINIRRVVYKGGDNFAPTVLFSVDASNVAVGGTIQFDASATTDPDHGRDELTFTWDFGDGSEEQTGVVVSHQYDAVGVYEVVVTVVDPDGASGRNSQVISVGTQPTVEIISPAEGTTFAVGDVLFLEGAGADSEGNPLDEATQLMWEVRQHHNNHFHPFLEPTLGNKFEISEAPQPEDFSASTNSYLEILLTGTDANGVPTTVSRLVMPRTVNLDFDSEPTGLSISLDEELLVMPQRVLTWENHNLRVVIPENEGYVFTGWKQDAVAVKENALFENDIIVVPANISDTVPLYIAMFEPISPPVDEPADAPAPAPTTPTTEEEDNDGGNDKDVIIDNEDGESSSKAIVSSLWLLLLSLSLFRIG